MLDITPILPDPTLPGLASAMNCEAMRSIFADLLRRFEPSICVLECQIERMKYKPSKSYLAVYRLSLCDSMQWQHRFEQLACVRCCPAGESQRRFARALNANLVPTAVGPSLLHLPELGMVVWLFPNDPKLHGLPQLMNGEVLRNELLPPIINELLGAGAASVWQIGEMREQLVHYAPEHTCTVRVEINAHNRTTDQVQSLVLYGKTYYNDDGVETDRLMRELWVDPTHRSGRLLLAQPLGYDRQHNILWQLGLDGKPLLAFEDEPAQFAAYLRQAASAVAALHAASAQPQRHATLDLLLAKLDEIPALIGKVRPASQCRAQRLVHQLLAQAAVVQDSPTALLHGDLHLQNFLVHNDRIALIDMDNLVNGSPWQDVGSFVAALHYRGLVNNRTFGESKQITASFLAAYACASRWHYSSAAVDWHTAAALLCERIYRTVSRWKGGKLELIDALLDAAERVLAQEVASL